MSRPAARQSWWRPKVLFGVIEAPGLSVVERRGDLDGNWVTNFAWCPHRQPAVCRPWPDAYYRL